MGEAEGGTMSETTGIGVAFGVPEGRRWPDEDLARLLFDCRGANPPQGCSSLPFAEQPEAIRAVFLAEAARLNERWWGDATAASPCQDCGAG